MSRYGLRALSRRPALAALCAFLASACDREFDTSDPNRLHSYIPEDISGFDPVKSSDIYTARAIAQVYEGLLQYSYLVRPYQVEPCLAESMPLEGTDKEGRPTLTFRIKKGIRFQNDPCFRDGHGRELVAEDFVYSFKRLADAKSDSSGWWLLQDRIVGLDEFREASKGGSTDYGRDVEGLQALDPNTFRITLKAAYPQIYYVLTMTYTAAVPSEAVERYGEDLIRRPVGTGPYRLVLWDPGSKILFERNPGFREELYPSEGEPEDGRSGLLDDAGERLPFIDEISIEVIVEDQPRWLSFMDGQLDHIAPPKDNFAAAVNIRTSELEPDMREKGIALTIENDPDLGYYGFNMDDPLVGGNVHLRRAMSLAWDHERVIDRLLNGRGIAAQGPVPPGLDGNDPAFVNSWRQYDLARAREELAVAGYPKGSGLPPIRLDTVADLTSQQWAEFFQEDMKKIGIEIRYETQSWPRLVEKVQKREVQMFFMGWIADYPDGENFLQLFYGPNSSPNSNSCNYQNPEFDRLYDATRTMSPGPERTQIYEGMVRLLAEDCPCVFGYHAKSYILRQSWLRNYKRQVMAYGVEKYWKIVDRRAPVKRVHPVAIGAVALFVLGPFLWVVWEILRAAFVWRR